MAPSTVYDTRELNDGLLEDYIRKLSRFLKGSQVSQPAIDRRPAHGQSHTSSVWFWQRREQHAVISIDADRLFQILLRLEADGINVGPLDIIPDSPLARPLFSEQAVTDRSDTLSIASFRSSISAISKLSLQVPLLFYRQPPVQEELKFIYSSFTRLPSLSIHSTTIPLSTSNASCVPLDCFKNIQRLDLLDIDPRRLFGWDKVAQSIRVLTLNRCALEDVAHLFVGAVVKDSSKRLAYSFSSPSTLSENQGTQSPSTSTVASMDDEDKLPLYAWSLLLSLSIRQTGLTFLPSLPHLPQLTHLDLSSNLLIAIPQTLSSLFTLTHLNLSDNMIESTVNAYQCVGAISYLNLSKNRLDSCVGIDKLMALEKVDLCDNNIEEVDELGRLSNIPTIKEIGADGNPLEYDWRIRCFNRFYADNIEIILDGSSPSILERPFISTKGIDKVVKVIHDTTPLDSEVMAVSPVKTSPRLSPHMRVASQATESPPSLKQKKRNKRIVNLQSGDGTLTTSDLHHQPRSSESMLSAVSSEHAHQRRGTDIGLPSPAPMTPLQVQHRSRRALRVSTSMHESSDHANKSSQVDFRTRMEALRNETGEDWLRVLAQQDIANTR